MQQNPKTKPKPKITQISLNPVLYQPQKTAIPSKPTNQNPQNSRKWKTQEKHQKFSKYKISRKPQNNPK